MEELSQEITDQEISLKEIISSTKETYFYLLKKWKIILLYSILGGIIGLSYTYLKKPLYTAETTFVLEEGESSGGLGAYAGLASIVGIDLGGGGGGIFKGDNIIELYKSHKMIKETLLTPVVFKNKSQLLIDRYIDFNYLREDWKKNDLNNIDFKENNITKSRIKDSLIIEITKNILKNNLTVSKLDKKLSIIKVTMSTKDEFFSKSFAEVIVQKVNQFYVDTKTKKSLENLSILQKQADSLKSELNKSISGVAQAIDTNPNSNPAFQKLRVPSQKKQVEVQANGTAYGEILKNLELAKITFRKDKPLIQVIDAPIYPLKTDKTGKFFGVAGGGLLFIFFSITFLLLKKYLTSDKK